MRNDRRKGDAPLTLLPLPLPQIYEPNNRCPFAWPIKCRHFMPLNGNGNIGHCNAVGSVWQAH